MQNLLTYLLIKGFRLSFLEEAGRGEHSPAPLTSRWNWEAQFLDLFENPKFPVPSHPWGTGTGFGVLACDLFHNVVK